jgi:hypothetical protein
MSAPESNPIQQPSTDVPAANDARTGSTTSAPVDGKSLAIGVLSVTAAIFVTAFLLLTTLTKPAQAIGMIDSGGDYKMLTQFISSSQEGIVVIDLAAQRMILYGFDYSRRQLMPLSGFELKDLKKPLPTGRPTVPTKP